MSSAKKIFVPRGTADMMPEESARWLKVETFARRLLRLYGYQEIRTPAFEEIDLFARSIGQTSDIVQKQMLTLASQKEEGGSAFALRPEGTAAVVRAYIEHSLHRKEALSKLFYLGPMFRGERPQKGRLRQFHQIGAEAIGPDTTSPYLDAEMIALSVNILKDLGLNGFQLKINSLGSPEDKEQFSKILRERLNPLAGELCEDCRQRYERNVFRILDCKQAVCRAVVDRLAITNDYLSPESRAYFADVQEALTDLGVTYETSLRLVRGLDYYTHTVFEISDPSLGSQDALGAGGRYNHLVAQLGGPSVDAVGFALGMERILLAMPMGDEGSEGLDAFVVALDSAARDLAFRLVFDLRAAGLSADWALRGGSAKSQMRQADKNAARTVVILGEEELAAGEATVKDMRAGTQGRVRLSEVPRRVQELLTQAG